MKLGVKLVVSTTLVIAILFACYGSLTVSNNFKVSYEQTVNENVKQHILYRYSMESSLRQKVGEKSDLSKSVISKSMEELISYGKDPALTGVILEKEIVWTNAKGLFENGEVITYYTGAGNSYLVREIEHNIYMFVSSRIELEEEITIVNAYNLTALFEERNRQSDYYSKWFLIIIASYIGFAILLIEILTHPIKRLNKLSNDIAKGNYSERTKVKSSDEIGELSRSFDRMTDAIQEHVGMLENEVKNRENFVSDFSHELKTPMTAMMGYSKLLLRESCSEELQKTSAVYIYSECKRLELLSRKLLSLLQLDETAIELVSVSTEWLQESIEQMVQPLIKESSIQWLNTWEPCFVKGDGSLLIDLIRNLIENAKNASSEEIMISVIGHRIGKHYQISVSDGGCGIPKEEVDKILQPFYMVDKARSRQQGNSGIGLALCEKIARVHNTELKIVSKIGEGTVVSITLEVENEESNNL